MGRKELTILVNEVLDKASNPYRTRYWLQAAGSFERYRVVLMRSQDKIKPTIDAGDLIVIYRDRHTGGERRMKQ